MPKRDPFRTDSLSGRPFLFTGVGNVINSYIIIIHTSNEIFMKLIKRVPIIIIVTTIYFFLEIIFSSLSIRVIIFIIFNTSNLDNILYSINI